MEEMNAVNGTGKKSNIWVWAAVIVVVLVILFFMFRGGEEAGAEKKLPGTGNQGTGGQQQAGDEIDSLDVGANPDLGVDDLNSLQVSQEEITG